MCDFRVTFFWGRSRLRAVVVAAGGFDAALLLALDDAPMRFSSVLVRRLP